MIVWVATSCVLILAVLLLRAVAGDKVSGRLRYGLWLVVLLRLLIPVQLIPLPEAVSPALEISGRLEEKSVYLFPTDWAPVEQASTIGVYVAEDGTVGVTTSMGYAQLKNGGETVVRYMDRVSPLFLFGAVWIAGSVIFALTLLLCSGALRRRLRGHRQLLTLNYPLPVYVSESIDSPCLLGFLRPAVYITGEVLEDETMLRHVLAHERAHYLQGDHLWSALRCVALVVHWWNPLVWAAVLCSKEDGELACDECALRELGDGERKAYGETLIRLVTSRPRTRDILCCAASMTGGSRALTQRIERIARSPRRYRAVAAVVVIAVVLIFGYSFARVADRGSAVSDHAQAVILAAMNTPNEELFAPELVTVLGTGVGNGLTDEEKAEREALRARIDQNWRDCVGHCFSPGSFEGFRSSVLATRFHVGSFAAQYTSTVASMTLISQDDKTERVEVALEVNGEIQLFTVVFHKNTDGLFYRVELNDGPA